MSDHAGLQSYATQRLADRACLIARALAGHRLRQRVAPFFLVAGIGLAFHPGIAAATLVNADELSVTVTRSDSTVFVFDDPFSRNTTMIGGSGTAISSGVSFSDGGTPNYFVRGSIPESMANNGQATFNTANGIFLNQPPPFISSIQETNAFLESGTLTTQSHALTTTTAFTVKGLFDLSAPSVILGTYAFALSNRYTTNSPSLSGNVLEIRMRDCQAGLGLCGADTGEVIQFVWLNYITDTDALIGQVQLSAAQLANPQLEFEFTKDANSDVVSGFYALGSGNTLGTFSGGALTSLGSTGSTTDVFTTSLQTVEVGITAFDPVPVPEPSSVTLLCGGLIVLGGLAWGRRRA